MFAGGRHDLVVGVEIAVCQVVAHAGDVGPRDVRLFREQVRIDVLDRFADLDQSHPYRIEDETISQGAACEVRLDSSSGREDAVEPLDVGSHSGIASANAKAATPGFMWAAGTTST